MAVLFTIPDPINWTGGVIQWSQRLKYSAQENWYGPWFNLQVLGACPQVFSPTEKQRKRHLDLGELPKGDYWWSPSSWWGPPTAAHEEWTEKASQWLPTPWPLPSGRMEAGICRKNLSFSLGTEPQQAPESWAGTSPLHWLLLLGSWTFHYSENNLTTNEAAAGFEIPIIIRHSSIHFFKNVYELLGSQSLHCTHGHYH